MALLVGLGSHVDAVLVAQVVPDGVIRIVACADGIDVQTLHDLYVLNHALAAHHIAPIGVKLMAVCTLDENGLAVDKQLSVLDFNLAETYLLGNDLYRFQFGQFHFDFICKNFAIFGPFIFLEQFFSLFLA